MKKVFFSIMCFSLIGLFAFSTADAKQKASDLTLKSALSAGQVNDVYFKVVKNVKFTAENANGELQTYMNQQDTSKQWTAIINIVKAAQQNRDIAAKRSILKALSSIEVKKGTNFTENALKGSVVKSLNDQAAAEPDAESQAFITAISGKF